MTTTAITEQSALATIINEARGARHLASLVFPFEPVPASRPRVTRWGSYYNKTYTTWREHAQQHLKPGDLELEKDDALLVVILAVATKAKTSKLKFPRADVDNYAKGPMDAITKATGWWHDDKQVTTLLSAKRFALPTEEPHFLVEIYRL